MIDVGNRANRHRLHDWRTDRIQEFKGSDLVKMGDFNLICTSQKSVEWMLKKNFRSITKAQGSNLFFYNLRRFIGANGIFTLRHGSSPELKRENDLWFHQRKIASLIFTKNKFKSLMQDTFKEKSDIFIKVCEQAAQKNEVIDIQSKFFAFTIDSIQNIFFGRKVDTLMRKEIDPFGEGFDEAHRAMVSTTHSAFAFFMFTRLILPFPFGDIFNNMDTSLIMSYLMHQTDSAKAFAHHVKTLDNIAKEVISEARRDPDLEKRRDLLALFISSKMGFSDADLRDIILNLTIAGRDTTACTLTWMAYIIAEHPDIEKELCAEIDRVLQGRQPTLEDLSPENMPYLNGVLFESLRLFPPVPADGKVVSEDTEYLDGTKIPKGVRLFFIPYSMGRDPDVYPDPLKVDPNRWIPFKMPDAYAFPVFQAGPRFCLGRDMAQFEAKFVIASLYQKFTFKLKEGESEKITYSRSITMNLCNSKAQDSHELLVIPQLRQPVPS